MLRIVKSSALARDDYARGRRVRSEARKVGRSGLWRILSRNGRPLYPEDDQDPVRTFYREILIEFEF